MKRIQILNTLLVVLSLLPLTTFSQLIVLNEDFSSTSGTQEPADWDNFSNIPSQGSDLWHFNNPGERDIPFPFTGNFAIFDSQTTSDNGSGENVTLLSKSIDASAGGNCVLTFDYFIDAVNGASALVEVYNGTQWIPKETFSTSTLAPQEAIIDVSNEMAGLTNGKVRFTWQGNGGGFWAIDNIQVNLPPNLDGGIIDFTNPVSPFAEGNYNVSINLENSGVVPITNAVIGWSVDGVAQSNVAVNFSPALTYSQVNSSLSLGNVYFPAGEFVEIEAQIISVNGQVDQNDRNDTLTQNFIAALCGEYTIGGSNPRFENFTAATNVLAQAGVACEVVFNVRPGVYNEQISIPSIQGASTTSAITFKSEDNDSSSVILQYEVYGNNQNYTVNLASTSHITFNQISILRSNPSYVGVQIQTGTEFINFNHCILGNVRALGNANVNDLTFNYNKMSDYSIALGDYWYWATNENRLKNIIITNNDISSIGLNNIENCVIANNFKSNAQDSLCGGISIDQNNFNALVTGNKAQNLFLEGSELYVANNIFITSWENAVRAEGLTNSIIENNILGKRHITENNYIMHIQWPNNSIIRGNTLMGDSLFDGMAFYYNYHLVNPTQIVNNEFINTKGTGILCYETDVLIEKNNFTGHLNGSAIRFNRTKGDIANNLIQVGGTGQASGITLDTDNYYYASNDTTRIIHNNILITSPDPLNGTAISINQGLNLDIKNNIFANTGGGFCAKYQENMASSSISHNDYYTTGLNVLRRNESNYSSLGAYSAVFGAETGSQSVNPFFTSQEDLSPNQITLKDNALVYTDFPSDFYNVPRGNAPDIGAVEFEPCAGDLGINAFVNLSNPIPTGLQPIVVELSNQSNGVVSTATISWTVNGINQPVYNWSGNLQPEATTLLQIGTYNFLQGEMYELIATLSADCNPNNNLCNGGVVGTPLCGSTYTIGGVNPDFETFGQAAFALNTFGIECPVTFYVRDGVYEEEITLYQTAGSSAINTITFIGQSSNNNLVSLTTSSTSNQNYTLTLSGANYITFKHIEITRTSNYYAISLLNNTNNILFENCKLGDVLKPDFNSINNIVFTSNNLLNRKIVLGTYYSNSISNNITFDNNTIQRIELNRVINCQISNNNHNSADNSNNTEITLRRSKNIDINDNNLKYISSDNDSTVSIENNNIACTFNTHAIGSGGTVGFKISNNIISSNFNGNYSLIYFYQVWNDTIINNQLDGQGIYSGIWHFNEYLNGNNTIINGNTITNTQDFAILTHKSSAKISNNRITNFKNGMAIRNIRTFDKIYNNFIHCNGNTPAIGISLRTRPQEPDNVHSVEIYHNNVWIETTDNVNGIAIEVANGYNHIIKNNNFFNGEGGYAAVFNYNANGSILDYNNYYSSGGNFASWNGSPVSNLAGLISASGQESHSLSANPNYSSPTNLTPNQTLLNNIVPLLSGYTTDINGVNRSSNCDIGAVEFVPCPNDRGLNTFVGISDQLQIGIIPIRVQLQNHGTSTLTSATINWSVNGVTQPAFSWTGSIASGANQTITLGNYSFQPLTIYNLNAWLQGTDCNNQNDSCEVNRVGIPLCGNYTIGGSNPNFATIHAAATYLNNIGVSCPVILNIRPGSYIEQVTFNNAPGSSMINTITLQGETSDSSEVLIGPNYAIQNNSAYSYTFGFFGAKHYRIKDISIYRWPYERAIQLEASTDNLVVENCLVENIYGIGEVGNISNITIRDNNMVGYGFGYGYISRPGSAINCTIENNFINYVGFWRSRNINLFGNRGNIDPNSISWYYEFDQCQNVIVENNRFNRSWNRGTTDLSYSSNTVLNYEWSSIYAEGCSDLEIDNNNFTSFPNWTGTPSIIGLYADTRTSIQNNIFNGNQTFPGISLYTEAYIQPLDTIKIENNIFNNNSNFAINTFRYKNKINGNKILNFSNGSAIDCDSRGIEIVNNYIHCSGGGFAKGITLRQRNLDYGPVYEYAKIYHNSVNIVSSNTQAGRALEILDNYPADVKNNIFANAGGGFAAYIGGDYSSLSIDYNTYYSTSSNFGYFNDNYFNNLSSWGQAVGGDANSLELNPFFETETELLPFQRQINGAGIGIPAVNLDIDGEIRNLQAPDMGAQEFMIDFGITDLLSPTLDCYQSSDEQVTIALRQFGDIPFINLQLAYQLNNGTVYTNTIPGSIDDDIEFTFNETVDLSQEGTYLFKIWLVDNIDDNVFNDTLFVERFRRPSPTVNFNFTSACANAAVQFNASATISEGFIASTEWDFGDGDMGFGLTTSHIYDISGTYAVTFRAYSNEGCFSEITQNITLQETPDASFIANNGCVNSPVQFTNQTQIPGGAGNISYLWNFGDGSLSTSSDPTYTYANSGNYSVTLTASNSNGCTDSYSSIITVNELPVVSFTLPSPYDMITPSITLTGTPPGGTFSGPGIIGNVFSPVLAGIGNHTIVYEYTNQATGCSGVATQSVTVFNSLCEDPVITSQPEAQVEACLNGQSTIEVLASGQQLTYQWYQAASAIAVGTAIPNAINNSYSPPTSALGTTYYYCKVSFPNGCYSVTNRSEFTVIDIEIPTFNPLADICAGGQAPALPLTSINGYSGSWTPSVINTSTPGNFNYVFTPNAGECATGATLTITITPADLPLFNVDLQYCIGEAIPALPTTSVNGISGSWTPTINSGATTTYTFTPSQGQCALSTQLTIVVNPVEAPLFNSLGSLCAGETAPILFTESENGISGSWSPSVIDNTTSAFYTFTPNADECSNELTIFVQVNALPDVVITGGQAICTGDQGIVLFTGTPNATVAYNRNNGVAEFITLNGNGTAQVSTGFLTEPVTYNLINASTSTCLATLNGSTAFTVVPSSSAGTGANLFLCNDVVSADLFESLGGAPTPNGTWSGPSILGNGFYGTFGVGVNAPGAYTYAVPGAANCPPSTATIFVNISNGTSTTIEYNDPFCTNLTGSQLPIINGPIGGTFSSSPAGLDITPAGGITPSSSAPGTYLVVYSPLQGTGCSGGLISTQVQITSPPVAAITPSGPIALCQGESVILTATPGSSYLWSNGETSQSIEVSEEDDYSVIIYNGNSCSAVSNTVIVDILPVPGNEILANGPTAFCQGQSVSLSASPGAQYEWSSGATTPSITATLDGTYQVNVTNSFGCSTLSEAISIDVFVAEIPTITPSGAISICDSDSQLLTATGGVSYLWSTNATGNTITVTQANNYTVTSIDANGCEATSAPVTLIVSPVPTPVVTIVGGTTFCTGGSTTLSAAEANSYSWSNGATTQTIVVTQSGEYSVTLSNGNNCIATSNPVSIDVADSFTFYQDLDGDGFGNPFVSEEGCSQQIGWTQDGTDCDDTEYSTNPGLAEQCNDQIDNNCNDLVDEECDGAGCTDELACNFIPEAVFNDNSCTYPGCTDLTACNYNSEAGCLDSTSCIYGGCNDPDACNFDLGAQCNDGSCQYEGCIDSLAINFNPQAGCSDGSCVYLNGCTDSLACNYFAEAVVNDGSCIYPGCTNQSACNYDPNAGCPDETTCTYPGCTDPLAFNYNASAGCPNNTSCVYIFGCTDPIACNYDSNAGIDNNSCIYGACTDPEACNFDNNATCDDGSCVYIEAYEIEGEDIVPTDSAFLFTYNCAEGCTLDWSVTPSVGVDILENDDCSASISWGLEEFYTIHLTVNCGGDCIQQISRDILVTSLQEVVSAAMHVYPNPTLESFQLQISNSLLGGSYQIHNSLGMIMETGTLPSAVTSFNIAEWPAGLYTVTIQSDTAVESISIMKQ